MRSAAAAVEESEGTAQRTPAKCALLHGWRAGDADRLSQLVHKDLESTEVGGRVSQAMFEARRRRRS